DSVVEPELQIGQTGDGRAALLELSLVGEGGAGALPEGRAGGGKKCGDRNRHQVAAHRLLLRRCVPARGSRRDAGGTVPVVQTESAGAPSDRRRKKLVA